MNYLSSRATVITGVGEINFSQEAESLVAVVQDVLFLSEELQAELVEDIQAKTLAIVESLWLRVQPHLAESSVKLDVLHQLLADSTIAFPNAECLNLYRSQLTSFMTGKQSEQKMSTVVEGIVKCSKQIAHSR